MLVLCSVLTSPDGCGKGGEGGKGEEGIGTPTGVHARICTCEGASDIASVSVTVCIVVNALIVSSDHTDCDKIVPSKCYICRLTTLNYGPYSRLN